MSLRSSISATGLFVLLAALFGCSDSSNEGGKVCNGLVNDGPDVIPMEIEQGTTPAGGTIEDGRYAQTGYDYYADPGAVIIAGNAPTYTAVFDFDAGSLKAVVGLLDETGRHSERFTATYEPSGTELTLTYSCPEDFVETPNFTATPTEVRLFYRVADDHATAEIILTKR